MCKYVTYVICHVECLLLKALHERGNMVISELNSATERPLSVVQRQTAKFLSRCQDETVACTIMGEIDVNALVEHRRHNKSAGQAGFTHFILRALAETLTQHPQMNSHFDGTTIKPQPTVDIAIAVSMPNGDLVTPVLRGLENRSVAEIAEVTTALVKRVRAGGMTLNDIRGAGFTLSNIISRSRELPPVARWTSPIIPVPQTAILALNTAGEQAVVRNGNIEVATILPASLSFDHRVINGVEATTFLETLALILGDPGKLISKPTTFALKGTAK